MSTNPVVSRGLPAVVSGQSTVLVLGSLPSVHSIEVQQYYAHPRNAFWRIMQAVSGVPATSPYAQRCGELVACGVALWDVLAASVRPGSLDSAIDVRTAEENDIGRLLDDYPGISTIAFNGRKAEQLFRKFHGDLAARNTEFLALPSTSPAHATMTFEQKVERWEALRPTLRTRREIK